MKKALSAILAISLMFSMTSSVLAEFNVSALVAPAPIKLFVNNVEIEVTPGVYKADDKLMLPLRFVSEALGYELTYDDALKSVTMTRNGFTENTVFIGKNEYMQNGDLTALSSAPVIVDDRTFVPSDYFSTILSYNVIIDNGEVYISENNILREEGDRIFVSLGEKFSVELNETAGTGYVWTYEITPAEGVTFIENAVIKKPAEGIVGGMSLVGWLFSADVAGSYTLSFKYDRSFAPDADAETKTFTVVVY